VSKVDLRLPCGMPCSKLEVSTVQHGRFPAPAICTRARLMTLTFDQIDGLLSAAVYAVDAGYPDVAELNEVVDDLRERHIPRGLVIPFPRQPGSTS
jgi:hypothetical protein